NGNQFKTIGTKKGSGNSTQTISYSFNDNYPVKEINYYRLKQVDYDGAFNYSQIISIRNNQAGNPCFVYATETPGNFVFNCRLTENSQAQILNVDGRIMKIIKLTSSAENKIDLNDLSNFLYILRIDERDSIQNF